MSCVAPATRFNNSAAKPTGKKRQSHKRKLKSHNNNYNKNENIYCYLKWVLLHIIVWQWMDGL